MGHRFTLEAGNSMTDAWNAIIINEKPLSDDTDSRHGKTIV